MDPTCLEHALTGAERDHFNEQGYLHLKQVLDPGQIDHLTALTDNIWKTAINNGLGADKNLFHPNFIGRDQTYIVSTNLFPALFFQRGICSFVQ